MNFGTVRYLPASDHAQPHWEVRTEPHVRARLRRVFPRAPRAPADSMLLSDTPENARELAWFLLRYPMAMNDADQEHLESQRDLHITTETCIADLLQARRPPTDVTLALPARDYQRVAADAAALRGGLLLADDVGLGKTVSSICAMLHPGHLPVVVVCPTHLPRQWAAEIHKFAPDLRVHIVRKGQPYELIRRPRGRQADLWPDRLPDVVVINYHKLRGWAETLANVARFVVFDECQQLRNDGSDIFRACRHLAGAVPFRLGLSATPIHNYGIEFYPVIDTLIPGALGSRQEFLREWCTGDYGQKSRIKDTEAFAAYLRREGIMLRRTRAEVGRELPKLSKIVHTVESDAKVLASISGDAMELARIILAHNEKFRGAKMKAAGEFDVIMRQATGIAKAPYVADFVRILVENGEPVLLYGWHRAVYDIWMERLADLDPVLYTGSESPAQKAAALEAFTSGKSRVLIMSLRSGAGVDGLQHNCNNVVFGEIDWSPSVHEQCIGRPHRDGQDKPVMAYFLVSDQGSDPVVTEVCGIKLEQLDGVRNPGLGMVQPIENSEGHVRRLAEAYLQGHKPTPLASNGAPSIPDSHEAS